MVTKIMVTTIGLEYAEEVFKNEDYDPLAELVGFVKEWGIPVKGHVYTGMEHLYLAYLESFKKAIKGVVEDAEPLKLQDFINAVEAQYIVWVVTEDELQRN